MTNNDEWVGKPPEKCDICESPITTVFIDGRTVFIDGGKVRPGPWAFMCEECHKQYGVGLGMGHGQKYLKQGEKYIKQGEKYIKQEG